MGILYTTSFSLSQQLLFVSSTKDSPNFDICLENCPYFVEIDLGRN